MLFTLNEFSWPELIRLNTDGVARNGDPGSSYRSAITTQATQRATSVTAGYTGIGTNIPC